MPEVPALADGALNSPEGFLDDKTAGLTSSTNTNASEVFVTMASEREELELEVSFLSSTKGTVQNPPWDILSRVGVDSTARVELPRGLHGLLVTWWLRMDPKRMEGGLKLCVGGNDYPDSCRQHWTLREGEEHPKTELLQPVGFFRIHFRFVPEAKEKRPRSFRLLFSFHDGSALPRQLPDGAWNCSVPHYWPDFQHHLACNLARECAGGEDEAGCDYESEFCGPGLISAAGGCYRYMEVRTEPVSWYEAGDACMRAGGYLVSLNTPREWAAVTRLLQRLSVSHLYSGLTLQNPFLSQMYHHIPMWADKTMAYYRRTTGRLKEMCSSFDFSYSEGDYLNMVGILCRSKRWASILCEMRQKSSPGLSTESVALPNVTAADFPFTAMIECPSGHKTHAGLACDPHSACWARGHGSGGHACYAPMTSLPPSFACADELYPPAAVPFSLVCDFRSDCGDGSDEDFCVFPSCDVDPLPCGNKQCLSYDRQCDGTRDCTNGVDETKCPELRSLFKSDLVDPPFHVRPHPVFPYLAIYSQEVFLCNGTFFRCRSLDICMPLYLHCNDVNDCPGREDELNCDEACSRGFYRCRSASVCLHPLSLCDGVAECPQNDDELFCRLPCPRGCECYALSAYCRRPLVSNLELSSDMRYLEARGSGMTLADVINMTLLVHLGLSGCGLRHLDDSVFLPNVLYLDVMDNLLTVVTYAFLFKLSNLRELLLDGNPLDSLFINGANATSASFPSIRHLTLSRVLMKEVETGVLSFFPKMKALNLSGSGVELVSGRSLKFLTELTILDVRGCPLTIVPHNLVRDLSNLRTVYADNYKLCCPAMLPEGFNPAHCHAPSDEISSCDALLRSDTYRVLLSVFSALALFGNLGSFIYRAIVNRSRSSLGFGVFVTHLALSDLLMGVYLAIIGVADRVYLGSYLWSDITWKNSAACSTAGFLSLLSSEVSAFLICFITLDRVLVLRFPFSQIRFRQRSAHVASGFAWTVGVVLAAVPLLPVTSHWQFFNQNGICLPLPITQKQFPGQSYSFGVMIVLNFVLFVIIGVGQVLIFCVVKTNSMATTAEPRASSTTASSKDLTIARRLITVAMSDFLCWFPIGVLGLLASSDFPISGEVNVAMAVLALPLNAALNPFIYTYNTIKERRQQDKERRLQKLMAAHQTGRSTFSS